MFSSPLSTMLGFGLPLYRSGNGARQRTLHLIPIIAAISFLVAGFVCIVAAQGNSVEVMIEQTGVVKPRTFIVNNRDPSRYTGNRTLTKLFYDWKWNERDAHKDYAGLRPDDYHVYVAKQQGFDDQGKLNYTQVRRVRDGDRNWSAKQEHHIPFRTSKGNKVVGLYVSEADIWERAFSLDLVPARNITHLFYAFYGICDYQRPTASQNRSLDRVNNKVNSEGFKTMRASCGQGVVTTQGDRSTTLMELGVIDRQKNDFEISKFDYLAEPFAIAAIRKMKTRYPHLKAMLSIGGSTLSDPFYAMVNTQAHRQAFIHSIIDTVRNSNGLWDGVDLDWEFPGGTDLSATLTHGYAVDREGFVKLVKELRQALVQAFGQDFELTAAISASSSRIAALDLEMLKDDFTFVNLMSYDLYGAWSKDPGHQTAVRSKPLIAAYKNAVPGKYATDALGHAVEYNSIKFNQRELIEDLSVEGAIRVIRKLYPGFPMDKLTIGVASYSRGWEYVEVNRAHNTLFWHGQAQKWGVSKPITNIGVPGTFESGVADFRDVWDRYVAGNGGKWLYYDEQADAAYIWQPHQKQNSANTVVATVHSFDSPRSVIAKGELVKQYGLAGLFMWQAQTDNGLILNAINAAVCNLKADGGYYSFSQRYAGSVSTKVLKRATDGYASKVRETRFGSHNYRFNGATFCQAR